MGYPTIQLALATPEGQRLYAVLSENFSKTLEQDITLKKIIESKATYFGSQSHIEKLVWLLLNESIVF